jgi:DNA-directed RNA polymerase specialized sigma24 family protein
MSTDSLSERLGDVPFEQLLLALRTGEDLTRWDWVFQSVVARVGAAIRHRFPNAPFADDAVQSACRTFFRRAREGRFDLESPGSLVALLVGIAYRKALGQHREAVRQPVSLPNCSGGGELPAVPPDSIPTDRLREAMDQQLTDMLERVEESLAKGLHRDILTHWFDKEYRGKKITKQQIARTVGCSLSTVERVFVELRAKWQPLVARRRGCRIGGHRSRSSPRPGQASGRRRLPGRPAGIGGRCSGDAIPDRAGLSPASGGQPEAVARRAGAGISRARRCRAARRAPGGSRLVPR